MKLDMTKKILMAAAGSLFTVGALADVSPVYTLTNAVVTQKTTVSGCSALSTGGLATATFYDDGTYLIERDDPSIPDQTGIWEVINGKSSYSVYMMADDQPLADLYAALDVAILANCQLKYPAASVSIEQPTVLTRKNVMVVKNVDNSAVATFQVKGKQRNDFKGKVKYGSYSTTLTLKGNVVPATL